MRLLIIFSLLLGFSWTSLCQTLQEPMKQTDIISKTYSQQWELDSIHKNGTFRLISYKPIYLSAGRWSDNPNEKPYSENPEYSATEAQDFNQYEAKFQLSFKTKLIQGLFWGKADIWLAYTQKAYWQIYNKDLSRAFRELNYEPELIFVYPLQIKAFGGHFRSAGVSINHESNGRDFPLSRSWNRIIFHLGYENENWIISLNPWIRSKDTDDENPAITKFIGNGEINAAYTYNRHQFYTIIRHPFDRITGGSLQVNYVFPMRGHLRGHVQFFHGYGETLVDYNHSQTTLGIGISFANW